jgi:hypothetical protein
MADAITLEKTASVDKERGLSTPLWCVHIEGLGDYIAAMSREAAEREASAINAYIEDAGSEAPAGIVRAVAVEWPFSAAGHARSLESDWEDLQRMAHRKADAAQQESFLPSLVRRIRTLVSGG